MNIVRSLMVLCVAGGAAACATRGADTLAGAAPPVTPTQNYAIKVEPGVDEILLAPHREGLSSRQTQALVNLVDRWRDAGGGEITIQRPPGEDHAPDTAAEAIAAQLVALGVDQADLRVRRYEPGERPGGAMVVGFVRDQASRPKCGRAWKSFTASADNQVNSNFGCAVTADIAAMIDNPADIAGPRPTDPADAGRREVVIDTYRKGAVTSSVKDDQANGAISTVVH